jgi:hypothetical protein
MLKRKGGREGGASKLQISIFHELKCKNQDPDPTGLVLHKEKRHLECGHTEKGP